MVPYRVRRGKANAFLSPRAQPVAQEPHPDGKRSQGGSPIEMQGTSSLFLADAPHILWYRSTHAT